MIRWLMLFSMVAAFWVVGQASGLAAEGPSAGVCRAVTLTDRASGEAIIGTEDIAVDYAANLAYISAYDRVLVEDEVDAGASTISQGGIYLLDLNELSPFATSVAVEDLTAEFKTNHDFRPHGIDLWLGEDGAILHAINRSYVREGPRGDDRWQLRPVIERFSVGEGGVLTHLASLRPDDNELMCSPNDLVSTDGENLFVTNDHGTCEGFGKFWEETLGLANGYLLHYRGEDFHRLAGDRAYPNGVAVVNVSNSKFVLVSETRKNQISALFFSPLSDNTDDSSHNWDMPGSPDNFSWTQDGTLLLAVIPDLLDFVFYRRGWFGTDKMASRVVEIRVTSDSSVQYEQAQDIVDQVVRITTSLRLGAPEIVFEDDGTLISGATVMADARDVRLIGAVLDDHIVVCQKETSPLLSGPND